MNGSDLRERFAASVAHRDVDRIDLDAVLRSGRRRHRIRVASTVGAVAAVLVLVSALALGALPRPDRTPVGPADPMASPTGSAPTASEVLDVACSPSGLSLSSSTIAAQPSGVVLRVSSTLPSGAYLTYDAAAVPNGLPVSGGDTLPSSPETWTKPFPPGPLTLTCSQGGAVVPGAQRTVTVTDPGGFFSPTTLEDIGCPLFRIADWRGGLGGTGPTRDAAAAGVLEALSKLSGSSYTVEPVALGYRGATEQFYLVKKDGKPDLTIRTWVRADGFHAYPDQACA